jgi:hypothetical protein
MKETKISTARRTMLGRSAGLLGGLVLPLILEANRPAAAKAAKGDFLYQNRPHEGKDCGSCKFFSPDNNGANTGSCALVEGVVHRQGWCLAYSPKT